jgi:hypothetical protein
MPSPTLARSSTDLQAKLVEIAYNAQIAAGQQDLAEDAIASDSTKNARAALFALA